MVVSSVYGGDLGEGQKLVHTKKVDEGVLSLRNGNYKLYCVY